MNNLLILLTAGYNTFSDDYPKFGWDFGLFLLLLIILILVVTFFVIRSIWTAIRLIFRDYFR